MVEPPGEKPYRGGDGVQGDEIGGQAVGCRKFDRLRADRGALDQLTADVRFGAACDQRAADGATAIHETAQRDRSLERIFRQQRGHHQPDQLVHQRIGHIGQQRLLVGIVAEERGVADAGALRDLADGQVGEILFAGERQHRLGQRGKGFRYAGIGHPKISPKKWRLIGDPVAAIYDLLWIINRGAMADAHVLTQMTRCPYHQGGDERKSAGAPRSAPGAIVIGSFGLSRQILRSGLVRQAGFNAELLERFARGGHVPVLYQEGEAHQKQRSATARFFAPKIVATRYRALMERLSDALVARLRLAGRAHLDRMSLEIAVAVAAEILGLTDSHGMARRLNRFFAANARGRNPVSVFVTFLLSRSRVLQFFLWDVGPAIRARRQHPRDDVISHLIGQGYSDREVLTECLTYAAAGMVTTREFIVMAAWHLFERDEMRARFLAGEEVERIAILEEILRLEPVVGALFRRAPEDMTLEVGGEVVQIPAGSLLALDVRATNTDRAAAGECPFQLDPDRPRVGVNQSASVMSFGDGPHRCPGAAVALLEAAIFLERLFLVPGIRLQKPPALTVNPLLASYELRGGIVAID